MSLSKREELLLYKKAFELRKDIINMLTNAGSGHPGGSLSVIDIIVVLYYKIMKISPDIFNTEERDRFILSKGHACPALYAVLADLGFFEKNCFDSLRKLGACLQGHPDMRRTHGIEVSTGSLGQGLSMAHGKALAMRLKKLEKQRVYCIMGDGEMQEGQVWEALMGISHHKLDNITAFVDNNNLQIDGTVDQIKSIYPIDEKLRAYGWYVQTIDGHSYSEIYEAVLKTAEKKGMPSFIIAKTTKGKGVSFMENNLAFHGTAPSSEEGGKALSEIDSVLVEIEKELSDNNGQ